MRLSAYLSGYDTKVRMEEDVDDADWNANPTFHEEQLKQKLLNEYGKGTHADGTRWEWAGTIKSKLETKVVIEPRIGIGAPPKRILEEEIREEAKARERASETVRRQEYWEAYRDLIAEGKTIQETFKLLREG